jgi:hypothetical protein
MSDLFILHQTLLLGVDMGSVVIMHKTMAYVADKL